jgi:lipopolysaccharide export LptBFGC system permease protein LptF
MKSILVTILIYLIFITTFAQSPVQQTNLLYAKENENKASNEAESKSNIEQIKQELEQIKQKLKKVAESQDVVVAETDKLKQSIIDNNESVTLKKLMVIVSACKSFRMNQRLKSFPKKFEDLKGYLSEDIISSIAVSKALYGYYYKYQYINKDHFKIRAIPAIKGKTGERTFVVDETGVIIDETSRKPVSCE